MACSGQQIRYECLANSPELFWSSPEYIGPTGVMIEFSGSIDNVGTTKRAGNAEATLLGLDGINVTSSELVILVSLDYPTVSVACHSDDGFQSVTSQFKVPGMLHVAAQLYCLSMVHHNEDQAALYIRIRGMIVHFVVH